MALHFISNDAYPNYIALSTDISGSKINGASSIGRTVMTIDDNSWYIIDNDLYLIEYKKNYGNKLAVSSTDYLFDIAHRDVPDHEQWTKNGYNPALSVSEETLWAAGGDYVFPSSGSRMEIVSDSTDDISSGVGARTVQIHYLDSAFVEKTETIIMSGSTPVTTTATDIYRINNFIVMSTGTSLANVGSIDIRNIADTPIYSRIMPGINRATNCIYTVPNGKRLYIYNLLLSAGANVANRPVRMITKASYDNISGSRITFFMPYTNVIIVDGSIDVPIESPTTFPEGVDIKVNAISPDGAAYGAVAMRGWLETA